MARLDDHPRLSALVTVLLAVAVLVMAWGHDGTTTARAAVGGATGPLIADSLSGGAILSAANLAPGDSTTGEITVTNVGDTAGDMALGTGDLTDATVRGGVLSRMLDLTVLDVTVGRPNAVVFAGKLSDLHSAPLGLFEQNQARRFRFIVSYPPSLGSGMDDTLQGASTRVSFLWTATGNAPTGSPGGDQPGAVPAVPAAPADAPVIEDHVEQSRDPGSLKLRIYVRRVQAAHRRRVYVNVHCSHGCRLTATGVVSLPSRKARWSMRALKGSVKKAGTVKFRMPLPKKALPVLNDALLHRKKASVKLKITARSGTQTLRWTRTIRLAR